LLGRSRPLDIRKRARRRTVLFVLMDIVTIGFYVLAAVIGLAVPIAAVIWFRYHFGKDWPSALPQYQALFSGLAVLFAASLAAVGVALTIANQRRVTNRQMAAQLREQDLVRTQACCRGPYQGHRRASAILRNKATHSRGDVKQ
jgi:hypothetical protein